MGQSTDGQICFGIEFEEDYEFPWGNEEFEDIENWWLEAVLKFKPSFSIYTQDGMDYLPNVTEEMKRTHHEERRQFIKSHNSPPVELVNVCSGDYPVYILAVPCTIFSASRGYPIAFEPKDLKVNIGDVIILEKFCKEYGLEGQSKPQWYLSSYWG